MKNIKIYFAIAFIFINLFAFAQSKYISVKDFFRNPEKAQYQLSPDGKYISHTEPYENRMNIFIQNLDGGIPYRITSVKDRDIWTYYWKGNNYLLYSRDFGGDENEHIFRLTKDGKEEKDLTPFENTSSSLFDDLPDHPTDVLIQMNKENKQLFDVYRLNVVTGEIKMVAANPGGVDQWVTDHEGKVRLAIKVDGLNTILLHRKNEEDPFKPIITTNFTERVKPLFFTPDNKYLYAISNIGRDKAILVKIDPSTGKEIEKVYENPNYDVSYASYTKKTKNIQQLSFVGWKIEYIFLDKEYVKLMKKLRTKIPSQYEYYINSSNDDESIFIVRSWNDRTLGSFYFYNKKTDEFKKIADISPWLKEEDLCEMKPIQYTSRDGLTIYGYLTLPKKANTKNLPVVINPHGGPWLRDQWTYNSEVQFLANRGYAVLQMNFRGSTGYGKKFWELSFKQYGKKMQDDITDGVQWLIKEGIADPKRIGIYGGSYGGYATLAGLAFTPDLYACGVDYVGISNLFTFLNTLPPYWLPRLEMWYERVGDPKKDSLLLASASPLFHVDKIKVPVLVVQGANDPRVKKAESDQIVEALKKKGVEVTYLVKENEGHGFQNEENVIEFYEVMEKFLEKYLKPN